MAAPRAAGSAREIRHAGILGLDAEDRHPFGALDAHPGLAHPARVCVEEIHSLDDPRGVDYRDVKDADRLEKSNLFLTEGRLGVRWLIADSRFRARAVFVTRAASGIALHGFAKLEGAG